jgi:hypothetical protein
MSKPKEFPLELLEYFLNPSAAIDMIVELREALRELIEEIDEDTVGAGTSARIGKARAALAKADGTGVKNDR